MKKATTDGSGPCIGTVRHVNPFEHGSRRTPRELESSRERIREPWRTAVVVVELMLVYIKQKQELAPPALRTLYLIEPVAEDVLRRSLLRSHAPLNQLRGCFKGTQRESMHLVGAPR